MFKMLTNCDGALQRLVGFSPSLQDTSSTAFLEKIRRDFGRFVPNSIDADVGVSSFIFSMIDVLLKAVAELYN